MNYKLFLIMAFVISMNCFDMYSLSWPPYPNLKTNQLAI